MTADQYALLVVDMQNGFCHPDGSFDRLGRGCEGAMDAVRTAAVAVGQARGAGIPVVFTRHVYRPGRPDEGGALTRNSPDLAEVDGLAAGSWDAEVCAELGCGPDDLVVDKVCVESTARSAFMRDFAVTLIEDCCAAKTRRLHELALEVLSSYELAEIASIGRGFDAGNPDAPQGRLTSPVLATA